MKKDFLDLSKFLLVFHAIEIKATTKTRKYAADSSFLSKIQILFNSKEAGMSYITDSLRRNRLKKLFSIKKLGKNFP